MSNKNKHLSNNTYKNKYYTFKIHKRIIKNKNKDKKYSSNNLKAKEK